MEIYHAGYVGVVGTVDAPDNGDAGRIDVSVLVEIRSGSAHPLDGRGYGRHEFLVRSGSADNAGIGRAERAGIAEVSSVETSVRRAGRNVVGSPRIIYGSILQGVRAGSPSITVTKGRQTVRVSRAGKDGRQGSVEDAPVLVDHADANILVYDTVVLVSFGEGEGGGVREKSECQDGENE